MKSIQPYLTVIADSFHEALASRVLWILLAALTVVLAAIAPIRLEEQRALSLHAGQVRDWPGLIERLDEQRKSLARSPGKRIWERSSKEFQEAVRKGAAVEEGKFIDRETAQQIVQGLNDLLDDSKLYDARIWPANRLAPPAKKLLDQGVERLSPDDLAFFNRLLVLSACRPFITGGAEEELHLAYGPWVVDEPLPFPRETMPTLIHGLLAQVMALFVGVFGVFVAILVTAPIIPRTFEAGAVDLLMSKPVSRSLLFLAKFFGGCAFILLNAGYFIFGLWLIVGLRFDLWSSKLLLCIPIFLFLFIIYYCVSSAAGVLWKNPIVSVVVTIVFWGVCFTVGTTKNLIETLVLTPRRLVKVTPAGESLLALNQSGEFLEWDEEKKDWSPILAADDSRLARMSFPFGPMIAGPVITPDKNQLLYLEQPPEGGRFAFFAQTRLHRGVKSPTWTRQAPIEAPSGASWLFLDPKGQALVVAPDGVYRLTSFDAGASKGTTIFGLRLPFGGEAPFVNIGPSLDLSPPFAAAMDAASGDLALYSRGKLILLKRTDQDRYEQQATQVIDAGARQEDEDGSQDEPRPAGENQPQAESETEPAPERRSGGPATLAYSRGTLLVAFADGRVLDFDSRKLTLRKTHRPAGASEPFVAVAAADGKHFAVLFHNGRLWLYDAAAQTGRRLGGDVSAVTFDGDEHLLAAERGVRVTRYRLDDLAPQTAYHPPTSAFQTAYRYVIRPFYTVFPKPGELNNVVNYLLTDQDTAAVGGPPGQTDLRQTRLKIDVVTPIWSSLAFVIVMLGLTCFYIRRADL